MSEEQCAADKSKLALTLDDCVANCSVPLIQQRQQAGNDNVANDDAIDASVSVANRTLRRTMSDSARVYVRQKIGSCGSSEKTTSVGTDINEESGRLKVTRNRGSWSGLKVDFEKCLKEDGHDDQSSLLKLKLSPLGQSAPCLSSMVSVYTVCCRYRLKILAALVFIA